MSRPMIRVLAIGIVLSFRAALAQAERDGPSDQFPAAVCPAGEFTAVGDPAFSNLVVNGSFELRKDGVPNNYIETLTAGSDALVGWEIIGPDLEPSFRDKFAAQTVDWIGPVRWNASHGEHCLDLDSGVRQLLPTTAGKRYRLSFDIAGNPESDIKLQHVKVVIGQDAYAFDFDATGKTEEDLGWVTLKIEFVAHRDETSLSFINAKPNANSAGVALDNVVVQAVVGADGEPLRTNTGEPSVLIESLRDLYSRMRRFEKEADDLRRAGRNVEAEQHAHKAEQLRQEFEARLGVEE